MSNNHNFYFCLNLNCEKVGGEPGIDYVKVRLNSLKEGTGEREGSDLHRGRES